MTIAPVDKPRLFIGSSTEGLKIAKALQVELDGSARAPFRTEAYWDFLRGLSLKALLRKAAERSIDALWKQNRHPSRSVPSKRMRRLHHTCWIWST